MEPPSMPCGAPVEWWTVWYGTSPDCGHSHAWLGTGHFVADDDTNKVLAKLDKGDWRKLPEDHVHTALSLNLAVAEANYAQAVDHCQYMSGDADAAIDVVMEVEAALKAGDTAAALAACNKYLRES